MASLGIGIIVTGSSVPSELDEVVIFDGKESIGSLVAGSSVPSELDEVIIFANQSNQSLSNVSGKIKTIEKYKTIEKIDQDNIFTKEKGGIWHMQN